MKQSYSHSRYVPAEMEGARATASRPISILWVAALLLQEGRPGEPHPQDMLLLLRLHEALGGHTPVFCLKSETNGAGLHMAFLHTATWGCWLPPSCGATII